MELGFVPIEAIMKPLFSASEASSLVSCASFFLLRPQTGEKEQIVRFNIVMFCAFSFSLSFFPSRPG